MDAGLIQRRKSQAFGVVVSIYKAEEANLCTEGGRYATVCEAHGTICNHETLREARAHAPHLNWCEECMEKGLL